MAPRGEHKGPASTAHRSFLNRRPCVSSTDDASILEPLPSLPWLTTVAAHGKTLKESVIGCGVLDCGQAVRTSKESGTTPFHCWSLVFSQSIFLNVSLPCMMVPQSIFTSSYEPKSVITVAFHDALCELTLGHRPTRIRAKGRLH